MLYKYKNLNNFKWILDIVLNKKLYAAKYTELNDPMEGIFRHRGLHKNIIRELKSEKKELRICSLSKTCNDNLMWAHYADGERGIVIGIKKECLSSQNHIHSICDIDYWGIPYVEENTTADAILSRKNKEWGYEQEVRVFTKEKYIKIEIEEIILGSRILPEYKYFFEKILKDKTGYNFKITLLKSVLDRQEYKSIMIGNH
jgi:hypothetical protein